MSVGTLLNWAVPQSSWERLETRIEERYGRTRGYAGFELTRIADHWLLVEEVEDDILDFSDLDSPHTQKTNDSSVPLNEEEKVTVSHRIHPETKEQLSIAASQYGVNQGVLLGYVIREYYQTDGWGYSLEALEEIVNGSRPEPEPEKREPTTREGRLDEICDRLDNGTDGDLLEPDIREVIADVAGPSVVDGSNGYFSDVLDNLDYVHHPNAESLYIPRSELKRRFDLTPDDPAIDRKPYLVLTKDERVEGIKVYLRRERSPKTVNEIHTEVFDGNGSRSYMRNLMDEVAASDGFRYAKSTGGKKLLRATATQSGQSSSRGRAYTDGGVIDG